MYALVQFRSLLMLIYVTFVSRFFKTIRVPTVLERCVSFVAVCRLTYTYSYTYTYTYTGMWSLSWTCSWCSTDTRWDRCLWWNGLCPRKHISCSMCSPVWKYMHVVCDLLLFCDKNVHVVYDLLRSATLRTRQTLCPLNCPSTLISDEKRQECLLEFSELNNHLLDEVDWRVSVLL